MSKNGTFGLGKSLFPLFSSLGIVIAHIKKKVEYLYKTALMRRFTMISDMVLFSDILNSMIGDGTDTDCTCGMPDVDVKETNGGYTLEMDLPGKTEKDVSVELDGDVLTISSVQSGETTEQAAQQEASAAETGTYLLRERTEGAFTRRFTLPDDVNGEGMTASFRNGVLTVYMPRAERVQPKRITVETAA